MEFSGRVYNSNERKIIMDKEHIEKVVNLCKKLSYQVQIKNKLFLKHLFEILKIKLRKKHTLLLNLKLKFKIKIKI